MLNIVTTSHFIQSQHPQKIAVDTQKTLGCLNAIKSHALKELEEGTASAITQLILMKIEDNAKKEAKKILHKIHKLIAKCLNLLEKVGKLITRLKKMESNPNTSELSYQEKIFKPLQEIIDSLNQNNAHIHQLLQSLDDENRLLQSFKKD